MWVNRGNHEARDMNEKDGFEKECLEKYDSVLFEDFTELMVVQHKTQTHAHTKH